MIKTFIFTLLGLAVALLVILTSSPAPAQSPASGTYAWEYLKPGSDRLVCQRISLRVKPLPLTKTTHAQPIHTRSQIVGDRFCADLTKPIISHQSTITSYQ
ncbi:MAG: hypothetical protein J7647_19185 [Cyanobacteria bacterium SBLK]|nr:hypothetical protein [Cyanobacteria bacterium SBLK]